MSYYVLMIYNGYINFLFTYINTDLIVYMNILLILLTLLRKFS
jgi:hypothetical protein